MAITVYREETHTRGRRTKHTHPNNKRTNEDEESATFEFVVLSFGFQFCVICDFFGVLQPPKFRLVYFLSKPGRDVTQEHQRYTEKLLLLLLLLLPLLLLFLW